MPDGLSIVKSEPLPPAAIPPPTGGTALAPAGLSIAKSESWPDLIGAEATRQGVDPGLAQAVAQQENGQYDPHARSSAGAVGLMQLMPGTAKRWGVNPANPVENIRGGVSELKQLLDANGGNVRAALMRYNGSPTADPNVTGAYADQVLGRMQGTAQQSRPQMTFATVNGQRVPVSPEEPKLATGYAATPPPATPITPAVHETPAGGWNKMTASFGAQPPSSNQTLSPETERILSGALGGVAGGFITGGPVGAAIGAGVGGGIAAVAQGHPEEAPATALTQAGYESVGQLAAWPIQFIGRRVIASTVATNAAKYLEDIRGALNSKLDGILANAKAAQRGTSEGVARANAAAGEATRTAKSSVADAQALADQRAAEVAAQWPGSTPSPRPGAPPGEPPLAPAHDAATPPPGPEAYGPTGVAAANVIQGQGQHSLDLLGQQVKKAAASGPPVNIGPVKEALERMGASTRTSVEQEAAAGGPANLNPHGGGGFSPDQTVKILQQLKDAGIEVAPSHPLPGALGRIQAHPDVVSFADAHILKKGLDDAVGNFEGVAKGQVKQITKGIRGQLRTAMTGHAPYDAATAAYQEAIPLIRKGYAPQIVKAVTDNPTAIARTIKPNEPLRLQMLHDVLTGAGPLDPSVRADLAAGAPAATTPPVGGGHGAPGQEAWNAVRASVVYERLIKPGIEKFDASWARFHPDSQRLLAGDNDGALVIANLKQMSEAYKASGLWEPGVDAAKGRAADASATAARTSEQGQIAMRGKARDTGAVQAQVSAARKPTAEETAFQNSSLAATPPPAQTASDILHVGAMHGMNVFRARALGRLLLSGPKGADLIEWSSRSSLRTQAFVRAVTGQAPAMALANMARTAGITVEDEPPMAVSHPMATPPPAATQAMSSPPPR